MGRIKDALKNGLKFLADVNRGFFEGARENSIRIVRKDALDGNDYFMLLCFSDFLGIPSPLPIIRWSFCPTWRRSWRAGSCGWRIKRIY